MGDKRQYQPVRLCSFIWVILPLIGLGQVSLERQVISPFSVNGTGSFYISSTGGQVEYTTGGLGTVLTQGFEQPESASLIVNYFIDYPTCGTEAELEIVEIAGCSDEVEQVVIDNVSYEIGSVLLPAGEYEAYIDAGAGCNSLITFTIDQNQLIPCSIFFPNTVTSNGDNVNDFWEIINVDLSHFSSNQVFIYNRWGQKVWQGENYDNISVFWQGLDSDGKELPMGTYFYEFRATDDLIFEGFIELFR